jgi:hypothetical protein
MKVLSDGFRQRIDIAVLHPVIDDDALLRIHR